MGRAFSNHAVFATEAHEHEHHLRGHSAGASGLALKRGSVTTTSSESDTLHWAYLEFAIRASRARLSRTNPRVLPVPRNVVEAIRYAYDFIDAAAEFAYVTRGGIDGDLMPKNWLTGYMDRKWNGLSLAEKLGMLTFAKHGEAFWRNDNQRQLFDDLRSVRDALTHPGIFSVERFEEWEDFSSGSPLSSREAFVGGLRAPKNTIARFAQSLSAMGRDDAKKAVEIALRHAERLEQLFGRPASKTSGLFGRLDSRGRFQSAAAVLKGGRRRFFDAEWAGVGGAKGTGLPPGRE